VRPAGRVRLNGHTVPARRPDTVQGHASGPLVGPDPASATAQRGARSCQRPADRARPKVEHGIHLRHGVIVLLVVRACAAQPSRAGLRLGLRRRRQWLDHACSAPRRRSGRGRLCHRPTDRRARSSCMDNCCAHPFLYHAVRDTGSHMAHCNDAPHVDVPAAQGRAPAYASSPGAGRCASATIARTCSRLAASAGCRGCARCCARHASLNVVSPGGRSRMNLRAPPRAVEHRGCRHHTLYCHLGSYYMYIEALKLSLHSFATSARGRAGGHRPARTVRARRARSHTTPTPCHRHSAARPAADAPWLPGHPSWQLPRDRQAAPAAWAARASPRTAACQAPGRHAVHAAARASAERARARRAAGSPRW